MRDNHEEAEDRDLTGDTGAEGAEGDVETEAAGLGTLHWGGH